MGKKILIADDSITMQQVISMSLASQGFEILKASNGKDATQILHDEVPDLVLIDIALPGKSAFEVKKEFDKNSKFSHIRYVLLVSAFEKLDEKLISESNFQGRLIKPFDPAHLRKIVNQALASAQEAPKVEMTKEILRELVLESTKEFKAPVDIADSISANEYEMPPAFDLGPDEGEIELTAPIELPSLKNEIKEEPVEQIEEHSEEQAELESDIRGLTESTIKLSGLDEMDWDLDDSKNKKVTPPPYPKSTATKSNLTVIKNTTADEISTQTYDDGNSNFLWSTPATIDHNDLPPIQETIANITTLTQGSVTRAEIEEIIRKEIRESFEKIARDELPLIAEKVIRKEIERVLSEP